jgi:type IV pilus assembly protein PilB
MARKGLGDVLVANEVITPEQLSKALESQKNSKGDLGRIVVELGYASDDAVTRAHAESLGMEYVDLQSYPIDHSAINVVPLRIAQNYDIIPITKNGQRLKVATSDPHNVMAMDDVRLATACDVEFVLSTKEQIGTAIRKYYGAARASGGDGEEKSQVPAVPKAGEVADVASVATEAAEQYKHRKGIEGGAPGDIEDDIRGAEDAPIVKLSRALIRQGILDEASDIHVEPARRNVRIRYRIDGVLHEYTNVPKYLQGPLISRFKIMSEMNIAERRIPQDGRIGITSDGKDYDLRVSCLPTIHGEKIVMRILDKSSVLLGLNRLGFFPDTQGQVENLIVQPNGLLLSTGPTGHGKTTTQYSILHKINSVEKNIITIEDPVEYELPGVSQVHVNRKAGLTFASALRSFLRQDPDIIMVGEVRDLETAEIAFEASLTGHLVLSTLHTNDAASAVTRLVDMGAEPFLISATVIGVLAQRLGRRICPECREEYTVKAAELRRFGFKPPSGDDNEEVTLARGRGCDRCRHTGYKGRIGIFEMMVVNDEIAELIVRRAPLADVREAAKANGMLLLREDGLRKVLAGVTTPDEVLRVVFTAGH